MGFRLDPGAQLGWVHLTVSDLERALSFYEGIMGLGRLGLYGEKALLGIEGQSGPLLVLEEQRGAKRRPHGTRGLYHYALLLPSREELAALVLRLARQWELEGASDHLVSEAVYLEDPDGHGIEVYRDRPREQWPTGERLRMATLPLDLDGLLSQLAGERLRSALGEGWRLPPATRMGHIHLHVSDLDRSEDFYSRVLGLDVMLRWHGASFLSAGGYHHHVGLNIWEGPGAPPPPPGAVRLRAFSITMSEEGLKELLEHLRELGIAPEQPPEGPWIEGPAFLLKDPDGNAVVLEAR
jgi:catechol 2,3-dioxygenase